MKKSYLREGERLEFEFEKKGHLKPWMNYVPTTFEMFGFFVSGLGFIVLLGNLFFR